MQGQSPAPGRTDVGVKVTVSAREQFTSFMMSSHSRCGRDSGARLLAGSGTVSRSLWDGLCGSSRSFGILMRGWNEFEDGYEALRFTVSPATLGVLPPYPCVCRARRSDLWASPRHRITWGLDNERSTEKVYVEDVDTGGTPRKTLFTDPRIHTIMNSVDQATNGHWWILPVTSSKGDRTIIVENLDDEEPERGAVIVQLPIERNQYVSSVQFSKVNPDEAILCFHLGEREGVILVMDVSKTFVTKTFVQVRKRTMSFPYSTSDSDFSPLLLKKRDGANILIVAVRYQRTTVIYSLEERDSSVVAKIGKLVTMPLFRLSESMFCCSFERQREEIWDCNDLSAPLKFIDRGRYTMVSAESGFIFLVDCYTVTVLEEASRYVVLSVEIRKWDGLAVTKVFSFP